VLVEASSRERVWGIGLNLHGFALMEVRHRLRAMATA
jgi:predicted NAD-dependent protein-ADP-ribosyltransferase YbiA (DUF1768 family)